MSYDLCIFAFWSVTLVKWMLTHMFSVIQWICTIWYLWLCQMGDAGSRVGPHRSCNLSPAEERTQVRFCFHFTKMSIRCGLETNLGWKIAYLVGGHTKFIFQRVSSNHVRGRWMFFMTPCSWKLVWVLQLDFSPHLVDVLVSWQHNLSWTVDNINWTNCKVVALINDYLQITELRKWCNPHYSTWS